MGYCKYVSTVCICAHVKIKNKVTVRILFIKYILELTFILSSQLYFLKGKWCLYYCTPTSRCHCESIAILRVTVPYTRTLLRILE